MKKNNFKNIAGLTLVEMLIGIVISSIMIAAMYTTYQVVNNSYSQVVDRAKISRSGRDIVEMMMRDIRMAGFKYILGTNTLDFPTRSYLEFKGGDTNIALSHDPIVIETGTSALGFSVAGLGDPPTRHDDDDLCCDRIHIVYDDFNQNDATQPYKRYKVTYFAAPVNDGGDLRYAAFKTVQSWIQVMGDDTGEWSSTCAECYVKQKIRDHLVDMEFIPLDENGRILNPLPKPGANLAARENLYRIRAVDVRLTFRSNKEFFKYDTTADKPRFVKGLGERTRGFFGQILKGFCCCYYSYKKYWKRDINYGTQK